jgi:hypothetical protein
MKAVVRDFWDMMSEGDTLGIIIKVWFFFLFMPSVLFMALTFWAASIAEVVR